MQQVKVHKVGRSIVVGLFVATVLLIAPILPSAAGAEGVPQTPPNAPPGSVTTYQINALHDGNAPASFTSPLHKMWSRDFGGRVSYPLLVNGTVFVATPKPDGNYGTQLMALDAMTGATKWGPVVMNGTYFISGIAADGANVYAINYDGLLSAFSQADGHLVWSAKMPGQYSFTSAPTVLDGVVYLGGAGSGGTLYAVSASNGDLLWAAGVMNGDDSSPAVTTDGVYVSYACGVAYRFDRTTGAQDWVRTTGCEGGGGKTPVVHNNKVYVRDFQYQAILDATTGSKVGDFTANTAPAFSKNVGFFLQGGTLRAIPDGSTQALWSQAGDGHFVSAPIVVGSQVVEASSSGQIYLIDADTGAVDWQGDLGTAVDGPDEQNASMLTGIAAAGHQLFVAASNSLVVYGDSSPTMKSYYAQNYIRSLYRDFLDRGPDNAGLNFWANFVGSGGARTQVSSAIALSHEAANWRVNDFYEDLLGRTADPGGLGFWSSMLHSTHNTHPLRVALYTSSEYYRKAGGTNQNWVRHIYTSELGRGASLDEQDYWTGQVVRHGRRWVAQVLDTCSEATHRQIDLLYQRLLLRAPTSAETSAMFDDVRAHGIPLSAAKLAATDDYFNRVN